MTVRYVSLHTKSPGVMNQNVILHKKKECYLTVKDRSRVDEQGKVKRHLGHTGRHPDERDHKAEC